MFIQLMYRSSKPMIFDGLRKKVDQIKKFQKTLSRSVLFSDMSTVEKIISKFPFAIYK